MISAFSPKDEDRDVKCSACDGLKQAPLGCVVYIGLIDKPDTMPAIYLCQTCGRDAANVIGFMCIKEGSWSKLQPRKVKVKKNKK